LCATVVHSRIVGFRNTTSADLWYKLGFQKPFMSKEKRETTEKMGQGDNQKDFGVGSTKWVGWIGATARYTGYFWESLRLETATGWHKKRRLVGDPKRCRHSKH
jgi:hypothetical protein